MAKNLITFKKCMAYLRVNETILNELIKVHGFETVKSGKTVKLDKDKIDEWISNLEEEGQNQLAIQRITCRFSDYIKPEYIDLNFDADNKFDAIAKISSFAKDCQIVQNHRWLNETIVARENMASTAVGDGIAFLHTRAPHPTKISSPSVLLARSPQGIEFGAIDNKPVHLMFLLLLRNEKEHLFSLSYLNKVMLNKENMRTLKTSSDPEEVYQTLLNPKFDF